jgi:hypothetical protein
VDEERERTREVLTRIEVRARTALGNWLEGGPSGAHEALGAIRDMAEAARLGMARETAVAGKPAGRPHFPARPRTPDRRRLSRPPTAPASPSPTPDPPPTGR